MHFTKQLNPGCFSTNFTVNESKYSKICRQARGYQVSSPDGFSGAYLDEDEHGIEDAYVDGLSITVVSSNYKHVWTYAVSNRDEVGCPCSPDPIAPPSFVKKLLLLWV